MRREEERLWDILEHIRSALSAIEDKNRPEFDSDSILQKAVFFDLLAIGEAASQITEELQILYPQVPWQVSEAFGTSSCMSIFQSTSISFGRRH